MAPSAVAPASFRALLVPVFVPAGLFGVGMGAAAPVIALTALELGAPVWLAAFAVALVGLGMVVGDLPAGAVVARLGERKAVLCGSGLGAFGLLLCLLTPLFWLLAVGVVLTGVATAIWGLARQSYLAEVIPLSHRARVMSSFGLTMRLGMFVGPIIGAGVIAFVGVRGGFLVQLVAMVAAAALMARQPDTEPPTAEKQVSLVAVAVRHRRLLVTLGSGSVLMGAARAAIPIVVPLWANHLGLNATTASLVYALAAAVDVACAYPAGHLMDRFGRTFVAVPSLVILALGYASVPLAGSAAELTAVALVLGLGNGFGNGLIMTVGADAAPAATRAEFLAAWRLTHDVGWFAGPLVVSGLAASVPLAAAVTALAAVSLCGAGVFARYLPRVRPFVAPT